MNVLCISDGLPFRANRTNVELKSLIPRPANHAIACANRTNVELKCVQAEATAEVAVVLIVLM